MDESVLHCAKDYTHIVDRVNMGIQTLRKELTALRKQDVKLLKQLIQISEVIQTFYQQLKEDKPNTAISPDSGIDVNVTLLEIPMKRRMPLVRQQSVPYYCGIVRSRESLRSSAGSSFDDISESQEESAEESDGIFSQSLTGHFPTTYSNSLQRTRSLSYEARSADEESDSYFDDVLRKNVQLWKCSESVT